MKKTGHSAVLPAEYFTFDDWCVTNMGLVIPCAHWDYAKGRMKELVAEPCGEVIGFAQGFNVGGGNSFLTPSKEPVHTPDKEELEKIRKRHQHGYSSPLIRSNSKGKHR